MADCRGCGAQLAGKVARCPWCGRVPEEAPAPRKVEPAVVRVEHVEAVAVNACPVCRRHDMAQRLVAIVSGQTQRNEEVVHVAANPANRGPVQVTTVATTAQSELARMLAPPVMPVQPSGPPPATGRSVLLLLAMLLCVGMGCAALADSSSLFGLVVFTVAFVLLLLWNQERTAVQARRMEAYQDAMARWQGAAVVWERLYYCHRDGMVFDPEDGASLAPSAVVGHCYARGALP